MKHESQHPFVAAAPFADDLRTNGFRGKNIKTQKNWHNDPTAYAPTGNYYNYNKRSQTVKSALYDLYDWLKNPYTLQSTSEELSVADFKSTFVYTNVMQLADNDLHTARSIALRLFIHYVGDIHQPLHAITKVGKYGTGNNDLRGHKTYFEEKNKQHSLHVAWDKGLTLFKGSRFHVTLPFKADTSDWDKLTNAYNEYSGVNPGSYSKSFDPYGWSKDSYNLGVSAYKDMHEGVPILQ
jgi:hypothetical protein